MPLNKICFLIFGVFWIQGYCLCVTGVDGKKTDTSEKSNIHATINSPKEHSKLRCLMLSLSENSTFLQMAKILKFDFEFTDQMTVDLKKAITEPTDKVLAKLFNEGISLSVILNDLGIKKCNSDVCRVRIVVKEPSSGSTLFEKIFDYRGKDIVYDSHVIADVVMPVLTGQHGPMLSTLAYCKQLSKNCKAICVSDYACKQEKILYTSKTINLAPRWHTQAPVLFFSQLTKNSNRLVSIDLNTNHLKIVCAYEGLNMQPSFSEDGSKAILCMSGRKNSELYLYDQSICKKLKKKVFTQITNNGENNASPCYLPSGDVVFCSDFETGQPQIYYLDMKNKKTMRLTNGHGYCAAPSYCKKNNSVVYCRLIKGCFQLFTINLGDKNFFEKQLTFDNTSKQEPVWSACGQYVAFSVDYLHPKNYKNIPQIAVLNLVSGKSKILTYDDKPKSFPCWTAKTYYS
jgi:tol-pal system beta propeller repeat protein TolB